MEESWSRSVRPGLHCSLVALAMMLPATGLAAQIPGGKVANLDVEAARFKAYVRGQVDPVLASWLEAWNGQGAVSIESHYLDDAVLAAPGGPLLGSPAEIANFARTARTAISGLNSFLQDFEASEGMAWVYSTWNAQPAGSGAGASGTHSTLLAKRDGEWRFRLQLFTADSLGMNLLPVADRAEPLPPVTDRLARHGPSRASPETAYFQLTTVLASLRSAWSADDAEAVSELMRDDALLQLPGRSPSIGTVATADLNAVLPTHGNLRTVELDFGRDGSLAFLAGRYYMENETGPASFGNYVAVFKSTGSHWLIRALVFT